MKSSLKQLQPPISKSYTIAEQHPITKPSKKHKLEKLMNDEEDIISKLPDEILTQILSYIPTRPAVATSVLSKRWVEIWKSVPNLDFRDITYSGDNYSLWRHNYVNYVDRVLNLNNVSSVRKVHIDIYGGIDLSRVNDVFKSVVMRNAKKFHLRLPFSCRLDSFTPDSFFHQKRLVKLELTRVPLKVPPSVYFPCLKRIEFDHIQLYNDESMKNLLSDCPVLANLHIHGKCNNTKTLFVCSSTLRNLRLNITSQVEIVIDAPKVSSLSVENMVCAHYEIINLSSLKFAYVGLHSEGTERLHELLSNSKISHVSELFLHTSSINILDLFEPKSLKRVPMFYNLIHLTLVIDRLYVIFAILRPLLRYTPNIVTISFKPGINSSYSISLHDPFDLPQSILSRVESVEITKEEEDRESMPPVTTTFILDNATALKKLTFHCLPICYVQENKFLKTFLK